MENNHNNVNIYIDITKMVISRERCVGTLWNPFKGHMRK